MNGIKIISMGVEIECGMSDIAFRQLQKDFSDEKRFSLGRDRSVFVDGTTYCNFEIRFWSNRMKDIYDFIRYIWSLGIKQNVTCGNHVHIHVTGWELLTWGFQQYLVNRYIEHFRGIEKYLSRLTNRYCNYLDCLMNKGLSANVTIEQLRSCTHQRYRPVNFCPIYRPEKTFEIRLFPYFASSTEHIRAIQWLRKTIKEFTPTPEDHFYNFPLQKQKDTEAITILQ